VRALVTGAAGFVGANLTHRLLNEGHEVHILVRQQANLWRLQSVLPDLRVYRIDLQDREEVEGAVKQISPDWVLHLAAYGAYSYQTDLSRMIQTNISGTAHLLQACEQSGFKTFINTGSSSEYGVKSYAPTEHEWLEPNSHYAVTKAAATHLCVYESQRQSMPITTLRLYSVYGPWEEPGRLMPTLLRFGFDKRYPPLVSPETARDFIYIDDVLDAYMAVLQCQSLPLGAVYNIGSGKQTQMREVVQVVSKLLKIDEKPIWSSMPQRIWDSNTWIANVTRANDELSWKPQIALENGLEKMAAWLRLNIDPYTLQNS
jgi:nucleoside-diphosphate-sugar epimerase